MQGKGTKLPKAEVGRRNSDTAGPGTAHPRLKWNVGRGEGKAAFLTFLTNAKTSAPEGQILALKAGTR